MLTDKMSRICLASLSDYLEGRTLRSIPEAAHLVWSWFSELSGQRSYSSAGPNPIAFADIEAFSRLFRWPMEPRHVEIILAMDRLWMRRATGSTGKAGADRKQNINANIFDAVFS